jgi:DNA-binding transcriptional ArsR family regulator
MFAARLPITRQAVAKHLAELVEAGVVEGTRRGREMQYSLRPEGLESAAQWLEQRAVRWDRRLQALARHVESGDAEPAS